MNDIEKIEKVLDHIQNVQRNCYKLGLKLIKMGELEFGRILIANGQIHDNSKFKGIEFDQLFEGSELLQTVIKHHRSINPHHPEYWGSIHKMPDVYIAEMVCDCCARSSEFGTNIWDWTHNVATEKYEFLMTDEVGQKIERYLSILLDKPFGKI